MGITLFRSTTWDTRLRFSIARKGSEQFYATIPSALAHALEIQKGEHVEWIVADKPTSSSRAPMAAQPVDVEKNGRLKSAFEALLDNCAPLHGKPPPEGSGRT